MGVVVARVGVMPAGGLAPLVRESEREGWWFVRRLADDWAAGTNRKNADPYTTDPAVGRVRRLYVLRAFRGRGVGRHLVQAVIQFARARFRSLRVRTESAAAGRLYEQLGFVAAVGVPDCTHTLILSAAPEVRAEAGQ